MEVVLRRRRSVRNEFWQSKRRVPLQSFLLNLHGFILVYRADGPDDLSGVLVILLSMHSVTKQNTLVPLHGKICGTSGS